MEKKFPSIRFTALRPINSTPKNREPPVWSFHRNQRMEVFLFSEKQATAAEEEAASSASRPARLKLG